MPVPAYNLARLEPRYKRLAREHQLLDELCERSDKISYKIIKQMGSNPPECYLITYRVKTITGIEDGTQLPIFGNEHFVRIDLPPEYPGPTGDPICYTQSPVWHPNIRFHGEHKGRICITAKALGAWHSLDLLVLRIGEILQYKNYLAENIPPFPEDETVAKWVREFAEPMGIVDKKRGKFTDQAELLRPVSADFEPREPLRKKEPSITIKRMGDSSRGSGAESAPTSPLERKKIKL